MRAFETAIRRALAKIDAADPEQRARIYGSARQALANSLAGRDLQDTGTAAVQSRRLEQLIASLDGEYGQPPPGPASSGRSSRGPALRGRGAGRSPSAPDASPVDRPARRRAAAPTPARDSVPPLRSDGSLRAKQFSGAGPAPPLAGDDRAVRPWAEPERRRRFPFPLVGAMLAVLAGIVLWAGVASQRGAVDGGPSARAGADGTAGRATNDIVNEWVRAFSPGDTSRISVPGDAIATLVGGDGRPALEIVSPGATRESEVLIELPPALLQRFAGRDALVAMTVRAPDPAPDRAPARQIYVRCLPPAAGACSRHRFDVGADADEVVVRIDLTRMKGAAGPVFLAVNSDIAGGGRGIDLEAIRMRAR